MSHSRILVQSVSAISSPITDYSNIVICIFSICNSGSMGHRFQKQICMSSSY